MAIHPNISSESDLGMISLNLLENQHRWLYLGTKLYSLEQEASFVSILMREYYWSDGVNWRTYAMDRLPENLPQFPQKY